MERAYYSARSIYFSGLPEIIGILCEKIFFDKILYYRDISVAGETEQG